MTIGQLVQESPIKKLWLCRLSGIKPWDFSMFANSHRLLDEDKEEALKEVLVAQNCFSRREIESAFLETKRNIELNNSL